MLTEAVKARRKQLIGHISWLLEVRKGQTRMENAIDKWQSDLQFLNNYEIERQRPVYQKLLFEYRRKCLYNS